MAPQSESLLLAWLKALKEETGPALLGAFSLASTVLTFVPSIGLGHLRSISITCLVGTFIWANVRVFGKQRAAIRELQASLASVQARRARLVIHEGERSRYIAIRKSDQDREAIATYFEFQMAIENKGGRNSTINRYDLEIREMGKYENLKPRAGGVVMGVRADHAQSQPFLMSADYIGVEQEKMTPRGFLPLLVTAPPPKQRGPLHCTLTISDTEGNSALHEFILHEAG
jgi:hypothetical protein